MVWCLEGFKFVRVVPIDGEGHNKDGAQLVSGYFISLPIKHASLHMISIVACMVLQNIMFPPTVPAPFTVNGLFCTFE